MLFIYLFIYLPHTIKYIINKHAQGQMQREIDPFDGKYSILALKRSV